MDAGQKCSALSRLYVPASLWNAQGGFREQLVAHIDTIKVGAPTDFANFMGPVMFVTRFRVCVPYVSADKGIALNMRTKGLLGIFRKRRTPAGMSSLVAMVSIHGALCGVVV